MKYESLTVKQASYRVLVLVQSAPKISTREHQGMKQGASLSEISQEKVPFRDFFADKEFFADKTENLNKFLLT